MSDRTPIVLLGMHRSGTSALARSLAALGAWMGSPEHISRRSEHALMQSCNQQVLAALGGHWSAPPPLEPGWSRRPEVRALEPAARRSLADFEGQRVFAWKDPRNALTFEMWCALLEAEPVVVIPYRHPLEVAASLARRNHFGTGLSCALWEVYNRAALRSAAGHRTVLVHYADLVAHPGATLRSLQDDLGALGVDLAGDPGAAAAEIDAARRHHVAEELAEDLVTPQQMRLWSALRAQPPVQQEFVTPALERPHVASSELIAARGAALGFASERLDLVLQLRSRKELARRLVHRTWVRVRGLPDLPEADPDAASDDDAD